MPQPEVEEARDWAELPLDALLAILHRLDQLEIMMGSGQVCRSWRRSARDEPELWRRIDIDMRGHVNLPNHVDLNKMAMAAVRRSAWQCEAFWGKGVYRNVLPYLSKQAPALKSLRLIYCLDILNDGLMEAVKGFPVLEELELSLCPFVFGGTFEFVGNACPLLKRLRINKHHFEKYEFAYKRNEEALGIATMHELRSLQLFGCSLTNGGLEAILDNCPHLESLDIRHCFNVNTDDRLRAKCAGIKTLRLPHDSTDDYEYDFA